MSAQSVPGPSKHLSKLETKLRGRLERWQNTLTEIIVDTDRQVSNAPFVSGYKSALSTMKSEIEDARKDITTVTEMLQSIKSDIDFRTALVKAWPSSGFLDKISYLGTGLLGAGGAAFLFAGWIPAVILWAIGAFLMWYSLWGLRTWEYSRWDFFADQFDVEDRYRPRVLGRRTRAK